MLTVIIRSIFEEDGKYHPQSFFDECLYEVQMLEYDRIDISKGIDINKINGSKECNIFPEWLFFLMKTLNVNHIFAMVAMI